MNGNIVNSQPPSDGGGKKEVWKISMRMLGTDLKRWLPKLALCSGIVLLIMLYAKIEFVRELKYLGIPETKDDCGTYLCYLFLGSHEFIKDVYPYEVPLVLFLLLALFAYQIAYDPIRDLQKRGQQIFIRCYSQGIWWFEKCIWLLLNVLIFFLMIYVFAIILTGNMKSVPDLQVVDALFGIQKTAEAGEWLLYLYVLPVVTVFAMSCLQVVVSMMTVPAGGFFTVLFLYLFSFYQLRIYLPGNYLMMRRTILLHEKGIEFSEAFPIAAGIALISILAGTFYIKRKDLI